jgi:hypothetical protein
MAQLAENSMFNDSLYKKKNFNLSVCSVFILKNIDSLFLEFSYNRPFLGFFIAYLNSCYFVQKSFPSFRKGKNVQ